MFYSAIHEVRTIYLRPIYVLYLFSTNENVLP